MKRSDELIFVPNSLMTQKTTTVRINGRVCVITRATSGVNYHAAKQLAEGGARLVLVCRNAEKAAWLKDELECEHQACVRILQVDFSHLAEVRKTALAILKEYPWIDVLLNNAGLHNTRRTLTENGVETVFSVNHLASFLFTRLLLPRMLESAIHRCWFCRLM